MIEINGIRLANNIRAERNRANLSMEETAEKLHIARHTLVMYEKDASKMKIETLLDLAKIFNCNVTSFFI